MVNIRYRDIKALKRRKDFLFKRVNGDMMSDKTYDISEYKALDAAIKVMEEQYAKESRVYNKDEGRDYSPDNWISHKSTLGN